MAIGHWNSLTECQKLTQSQLIPGVIEEDIKRNNILDRIPVAQAEGKSILWNRESATVEDDVAGAAAGDQLSWTAGVTYSQQETQLSIKYVQRRLDTFVKDVYGNVNDYEAQVLVEMKKGMVRKIGDAVFYDDYTYGSNQFDGLHAWAAIQHGSNDLGIEQSGALSLLNLRKQHDAMKYGVDYCYIPYDIARRIDAAYQEAGLAQLATATAGTMALISYGVDDQGKRVMFFDGVPFMRTDFLVEETADTGQGSDAKAKSTSGSSWSLFNIKFGDIFNGEPGVCLGFGNTEMVGAFYKITMFDKLEDYAAGGIRLESYLAVLLGSKLCLGRVDDITDAAIVY